jgi:RimJ/RimL family protein N-acetyltransferase
MKNFEFKKLADEDIPLIHTWLSSPHLKTFWKADEILDLEAFRKDFAGKMTSKKIDPYLVVLQGKPIGYIQSFAMGDKTFGIEQFIAVEEFVNKGLGSMFVKEFTDELLLNKNIHRIITDPDISNLRAQKAYEKAGFKKLSGKNSFDNGEVVLMEKRPKKSSVETFTPPENVKQKASSKEIGRTIKKAS